MATVGHASPERRKLRSGTKGGCSPWFVLKGLAQSGAMAPTALVLANDLLQTPHAKTSHGLIRGPSRFPLVGVVDATCAGRDAGEVLDGKPRGLPVFASVRQALAALDAKPDRCIVGVATPGGVLPESLRADLVVAAQEGLGLVNGLHRRLAEDPDIAAAARASGATLFDLRQPRPVADLHHWEGKILSLPTPRVAVLGTDCCVGKRTTATVLRDGLSAVGVQAALISTGQTGWLQGAPHGFFFDATPNDFVSGELERVVMACAQNQAPDLIVLEGQSSFFNPSGPCGSEFILSAGARWVVLQHAPRRAFHDDLETIEARIPPVDKHIAMAELLGAEVIAIALHIQDMSPVEAVSERDSLRRALGRPVFLPLHGDAEALVTEVRERVGL